MQAAIENFSKNAAFNKMLMLGAMMELGEDSIYEHQQIVDLIKSKKFENVMLVGGDFEKVTHPFIYFKNADEASNWLKEHLPSNTTILVKGSRSMKMEKLVEIL
jgi:UDP-N-acetylmuramoyl-tripeptide--D-alanyl-D-alanine ligase